MAGSLREIKAKIASIKQTSHITGAMQMVSASKLTRSEQAAKDFQIYASKIRQITTDLLHSELVNGSSNPMLDARPVRKSGYIVITSDKGLVGGYNSTILKAVLDMIKRDHDSEDEYAIISIGGTGSDFFKARNMNVAFELRGLEDQPSFDQVGKIISKAVGMYQNELFDEYAVYPAGAVCYQFWRGMANGTRGGCFRKVSFAGCGSAWGVAKFLAKPASIGLVGRAVLRCWSEAGGVS